MAAQGQRHLDYKPPTQKDDRDFELDHGIVKGVSGRILYRLGDAPAAATPAISLPKFRLTVSRIEDQGQFGACSGFAVSTMYEQLMGTKVIQLSPMFNYTNSRLLDGDELDADPGTTLQTACGNLRLAGICRELTWAYTQNNFDRRPSDLAYAEAAVLANSVDYVSLARSVSNIKTAVGVYGYLVSIGFIVGSNYESAATATSGDIQMEDVATMTRIGGHALNICGWDDDRQRFLIVNNYSTSWGDGGYGSIPYDYVMSADLTPEIRTFIPRDTFQTQVAQFADASIISAPDLKSGGGGEEDTTNVTINYILLIALVCCIVLAVAVTQSWSSLIVIFAPLVSFYIGLHWTEW